MEIKRINFNKACRLVEENINEVFNEETTNGISDALHVIIENAIEACVFVKMQPKWKKLNPWCTKELALLSVKKQNVYNEKKTYPHNELIAEENKRIDGKVNDLRRKLEANYYAQRFEDSIYNSKNIW